MLHVRRWRPLTFLVRAARDPRLVAAAMFEMGAAPKLLRRFDPGPPRPLERQDVPLVATLVNDKKALPDFISLQAFGASNRVRQVIERYEPSVHQFFEVSLRRYRGSKPILGADGEPLKESYYVLNPMVRIEAIVVEKSELNVWRLAGGGQASGLVNAYRPGSVTVRKSLVAGHHLWCGEYHAAGELFFSEELGGEFIRNKWKGIEFIKVNEE